MVTLPKSNDEVFSTTLTPYVSESSFLQRLLQLNIQFPKIIWKFFELALRMYIIYLLASASSCQLRTWALTFPTHVPL